MPIAHCYTKLKLDNDKKNLVRDWAEESSVDGNYMTINFITIAQQLGSAYSIMVNLYLPNLWSEDQVKIIQSSLAVVLAKHFGIHINEIHVITQLVESGHVFENGEQQSW